MAPLLLLLVVLNKKKLSSFRLTLKEEKDMKLTFHEKKKTKLVNCTDLFGTRPVS